jgi:hypothetical protein
MMAAGGVTPPCNPAEALLASLRAAAHAAVDAGDEAVAVTLTQLIEERARGASPAEVSSLDAARRRRRTRGK